MATGGVVETMDWIESNGLSGDFEALDSISARGAPEVMQPENAGQWFSDFRGI